MRPEISATFMGEEANVNESSILLKLDKSKVDHVYDPDSKTVFYLPPDVLSPGEHTVTLYAEDILGNQLSSEWSFTLSLLMPSVPLESGWNFISIPLELSDNDLERVFQSIAGEYYSVCCYDSEMGVWEMYTTDVEVTDILNTLWEVYPGKAYWIYILNPALFDLDSDIVIGPADMSIQMKGGWNQVGYNVLQPVSPEEGISSISGYCKSVWTYDSASSKWESYVVNGPSDGDTIDMIHPWKGYCIYVTSDCVWEKQLQLEGR